MRSTRARIVGAVIGLGLAIAGCAGPAPDAAPPAAATSEPPMTMPSDTATPDPEETMTAQQIEITAACEGSVTAASHLASEALTFTQETITKVDHRMYMMEGYVNDIDFSCTNIRVDAQGDPNADIPIQVTLAGMDMTGDY